MTPPENTDWSKVTVAISIRQPWAWLITHGFKDVENRTWRTNFRGPVLVHAGKTWGEIEKLDAAMVHSNFGIAMPEHLELGGIVGGAVITDCVTEMESPWFVGEYGFVLSSPVVLPFRALPGRLGFFNVRADRAFTVKEVA